LCGSFVSLGATVGLPAAAAAAASNAAPCAWFTRRWTTTSQRYFAEGEIEIGGHVIVIRDLRGRAVDAYVA